MSGNHGPSLKGMTAPAGPEGEEEVSFAPKIHPIPRWSIS